MDDIFQLSSFYLELKPEQANRYMRKNTPKTFLLLISLLVFSSSVVFSQDITLSQFKRATYSDLLIDSAGIYHAVFLESPAIGKTRFVYYSRSTNGGRSWSKPVTVSNDESGNGAAQPKLIQDKASGEVYAIWKRFGLTDARYPIQDVILEGPGGYNAGTLFFRSVGGSAPGEILKIGEKEETVISWFVTHDPAGNITVVWSQVTDESALSNWKAWFYADWIRTAKIRGGAVGNITSVTRPNPAPYKGGAPPDVGFMNLHGYFSPSGALKFVAERMQNRGQVVVYSDGKTIKKIYEYPKSTTFNTFNNPPRLLVDENGTEHLILKPDSSTLEAEELWDIDPVTGKKRVLIAIDQEGFSLDGFQAYQGPDGKMTVTFQAGKPSGSSESFFCSYRDGVWRSFGMSKNSAMGSFTYREFPFNGVYRPTLATLTKYDTTFVSVAHDKSGARKMLMTLSEYFTAGSFSTSSPSVIYIGAPEEPKNNAGPPKGKRN